MMLIEEKPSKVVAALDNLYIVVNDSYCAHP